MNGFDRKSKGFTLMELLVVIVILALLILLAGPQLLNLMEGGQQDTFRNDVKRIVEIAQTAYTDKAMRHDSDIKNTASGKYMCISLEELQQDGYLDKTLVEKDGNKKITKVLWAGWIEVFVPTNGTGTATYTVTMTNGDYSFKNADIATIDGTDLTGSAADPAAFAKPTSDNAKSYCSTVTYGESSATITAPSAS